MVYQFHIKTTTLFHSVAKTAHTCICIQPTHSIKSFNICECVYSVLYIHKYTVNSPQTIYTYMMKKCFERSKYIFGSHETGWTWLWLSLAGLSSTRFAFPISFRCYSGINNFGLNREKKIEKRTMGEITEKPLQNMSIVV